MNNTALACSPPPYLTFAPSAGVRCPRYISSEFEASDFSMSGRWTPRVALACADAPSGTSDDNMSDELHGLAGSKRDSDTMDILLLSLTGSTYRGMLGGAPWAKDEYAECAP